jgi:hypothetical protein
MGQKQSFDVSLLVKKCCLPPYITYGEIVKLAAESVAAAAGALIGAMPDNAGIIRIHVGGDFKTRAYFDAWLEVARQNKDRLFYAYTKSLPFWIDRRDQLKKLPNFVLTASRGGYKDNLIKKHRLRESVVVFSEQQAADLGLEIDHDDSHAADPSRRRESFALLIHGGQPAGSEAGKAVRALKGKGSYSRGKAVAQSDGFDGQLDLMGGYPIEGSGL